MFTDNKKLISTVLIICLVGLAGLFLGKFLINQQHLFINNRSSVQTATPLPELKFQLNHSRLSIQAGPNKEAATKLLFEMISFDQERDFFYLPQIEKYTLSLTPKKIVFTIRPIAEYSNN